MKNNSFGQVRGLRVGEFKRLVVEGHFFLTQRSYTIARQTEVFVKRFFFLLNWDVVVLLIAFKFRDFKRTAFLTK